MGRVCLWRSNGWWLVVPACVGVELGGGCGAVGTEGECGTVVGGGCDKAPFPFSPASGTTPLSGDKVPPRSSV